MSMATSSLLHFSTIPMFTKLPPSPSLFFPKYHLHKNKNKNNFFFPTKPTSHYFNFIPISKCSSSLSSPSLTTMEEDQEDEMENLSPLSEIWRDVQGFNDWEGLLDPFNLHLRKEIIRYGEFSQACYDSFDFDPHSKYCGTCKYQASQFFHKLLMADRGYNITRYLYATSNINLPNFFKKSNLSRGEARNFSQNRVWSQHANWMGYVAVATDANEIKRLGRRDIVIAWRGTVTYLEWIHDLKDILRPAGFIPGDVSVKIESGFYDLYTMKEENCDYCGFSAREQILVEVKRLVEQYCKLGGEEISITVTGHSLGAALALITAYDIAEMKLNTVSRSNGGHPTTVPVTVYSFGGPRVGNLKFKERCEELGVKVLRVINIRDKVLTKLESLRK